MPSLADELFLYAITRMPSVLISYQQRLGYKRPQSLSAADEDHPDSTFFSRGPLATMRSAILLYIIDHLPENQRWLFYWLMLFSYQNFMWQIYIAAYFEAFILWYWPTILPSQLYYINVVGDCFARIQMADRQIRANEITKETSKQIFQLGTTSRALYTFISPIDVISWLESVLGSSKLWPKALFPLLIGIFFKDERMPINAFTPTRVGGVVMAVTICTISKASYWIQWSIWPVYSCPSLKTQGMLVKWALCTIVWVFYGITPQVGYGLLLFMTQFPQAEQARRHEGGTVPVTLRWERYGCILYITTSIVLELFRDVPMQAIWPLLIGIYWLRHVYGENKEFKYRPLEQHWIRLLKLHARSIKDQIQCEMIHVSLDSPPKYTAVSHRWDSTNSTKIIQVDGAPFHISNSIHAFLLAKRQLRHHVYLWIDSICIDQTNTTEKTQQVGLMRKIYEEAHETIAWLGNHPGSEKAIAFIRYLYKEYKLPANGVGWDEVMKLFQNPWFDRSWIIQEIASSTNPVLRYGKDEIEWNALTYTISVISSINQTPDYTDAILKNHHLLNALVIENARLCIDNVDHMRLEDVLKLGIAFQATLPVDKVFALLGIAEERRHIDFSAGTGNAEYWHAINLFKELDATVLTIAGLTGALEGWANSRRSRKIISHPNRNRYAEGLRKYERQLIAELLWLEKRNKDPIEKPDVEYDVLRPEYSQRMTPEIVYTLVAKTALGKGDYSIMRHAGIGCNRNSQLENLPSWAPDWTSGLDTYIFPSHTTIGTNNIDGANTNGGVQVADAQTRDTDLSSTPGLEFKYKTISDSNFYTHTINGVVVGQIQCLLTLCEPPSFAGDIFEMAEKDFDRQIINYNTALDFALNRCMPYYQTSEAIRSAFLQTVFMLGKDSPSPSSYCTTHDCTFYIANKLNHCYLSTALWPENYQVYWDNYRLDPDALRRSREQMCQEYIFFRQTQASSHSKFAHMVKTEIAPSFNQYRWPPHKKDTTRSKMFAMDVTPSDPGISFFDDNERSLISAYSKYVDYTIGRKFAIIDNGQMGLVPSGAQVGDMIVQPQYDSLCLTLRESIPPLHSPVWGKSRRSEQGQSGETMSGPQSTTSFYRLVGESYIHNMTMAEHKSNGAETEFKLW